MESNKLDGKVVLLHHLRVPDVSYHTHQSEECIEVQWLTILPMELCTIQQTEFLAVTSVLSDRDDTHRNMNSPSRHSHQYDF